jgi:hypothetical protein
MTFPRNSLFAIILLYWVCLVPGISLAATFRFQTVNNKSVALWEGKRPVFAYNYGAVTNATAPEARSHSSYIHPIYGLDGEVLTGDFPKDHVYHRGLYWAWPHIKIGEKEYDLWSLRGIRQDFRRWLARETKTDSATLGVENGWVVDGKDVMREEVWIRTYPASAENTVLDVELLWTPLDNAITLWGAPEKSYGGLTFRFGSRSKTIITVPRGRTTNDLVMTNLVWADFSGDLKQPGSFSGAAVFVHPSHPDHPPEWMTRAYGVLAVGWPGVRAQSIKPGERISCRYRVWIHRGVPEATEIQKAYDIYLKESNFVAPR